MRIRFDEPLELRWRSVMSLDPGNSLGPIVIRFSLVREITPSREYAIRLLDVNPQYINRLNSLLVGPGSYRADVDFRTGLGHS